MNFFSIKTSFQDTIKKVISKNKKIDFADLSGYDKNKISIGDIVFIIISGDKGKKKLEYENGLRAIGKISKTPLKGKDDKHFGVEVDVIMTLSKSISKKEFYLYPSLLDVGNIGPDTKGSASQPLRFIEVISGQDVLRAINDITDHKLDPKIFDSLVDNNYKIEKLKIADLSETSIQKDKNEGDYFLQEKFVEWFNKTDNFKKSYEGLVNIKVLNFWNENYFNNDLFSIDYKNIESSFLKIEKLIANKNNLEWKKYSEATSKGAPEAVLGKNNYLSFLAEFLKDEHNLIRLQNLTVTQSSFKLNKQDSSQFKNFHVITTKSGLIFSEKMVARFIASLCTKPFVICSGLSGSGKTKLAQAFVNWICESEEQYKIIPVGADWTNREPLVGYPNGLVPNEYITPDSGVIHLLMKALKKENENKPFFLILDEMNLSHVERYFADFLSIMESNDTIKLYTGNTRKSIDGLPIPLEIGWPKNVFIIGTVNIDETTYMFSPKVLDRANVIEFRITEEEINGFLASPGIPDLKKLKGQGISMAKKFLLISEKTDLEKNEALTEELIYFFNELKKVGAEFGYRSATEIMQLATKLKILEPTITDNDCLDIAIMQKLLPKLHGSRSKLVKILIALAGLCIDGIKKEDFEKNFEDLYKKDFEDINVKYPISFEKLIRMYKNVLANGFTSYAEA